MEGLLQQPAPGAAMAAWRKYGRVFAVGVQNTFVYRWNFLIRAGFGLVPLLGTVCVWQAIFEGRGGNVGGYDFSGMVWYFIVILLAENLVTPVEDEWQIAGDIRDGRISALLTKPVGYQLYRFSLFAASRAVYTLVTLPLAALVLFAFREHVRLPAEPLTWAAALLSLGMAAALQFLIAYTLALCAFWILEISTIVFLLYSFEYLLSGSLFPLDLLPDGVRAVLKWLPFQYELFFPAAVFLGRVTGAELAQGLAIQAGWVAALWLFSRWLWGRGLRRYEAVGI